MSFPALVRALSAAVLLAATAALGACASESAAPPTVAPTTIASPTAAASPTATPAPTEDPGANIELPTACEGLYSAAMLATLQSQSPPLNDPDVTLFSTQNVDALDLLNSGVPTIRCSWGAPSESGIATNVSIIDPTESATLVAALAAIGYDCAEHDGGTLCSVQQDVLDQDDKIVTRGEQHYFRGNGWVATAWITYLPDGYTDDIVGTIWG